MKITIITLFPKMIESFLSESIIKKAQEKGVVQIKLVNLRDFALDSYGTVDDRPYGGGAGMVLRPEPLSQAIRSVTNDELRIENTSPPTSRRDHPSFQEGINSPLSKRSTPKGGGVLKKIILTSAKGKTYNQQKAREFSKLDHLVIIAGHYEGVDERVMDQIDEEISVGDFVLTGGEIPAALIVDSVVRLLPGVLKKEEATQEESFFEVTVDELIKVCGEDTLLRELKNKNVDKVQLVEYPHFTRPEEWDGQKVPEILLSGNHEEIRKWRIKESYKMTIQKRRDLLDKTL